MRAKFMNIGQIPVSEILLDQNNYRLGPTDSQKECIIAMFREFDDKMIKIAAHIAQFGLSPRPIVVSKNDNMQWCVRDGNRRITALKVLNNPAEAPEEYQKIFQTVKRDALPGIIPETVDCITADEATIIEYLKLEHMGLQNGIGQVPWDARAKDNMQVYLGGKLQYALAKKVLEYLIGRGVTEARNVKISNIQRLLQDMDVSNRVGIQWKNDSFLITHGRQSSKTIRLKCY